VNNKRKLGAAFISLAISGFAGLMLVAPGALAGGVVGTVLTDSKCDWQIFDIPASFAVASAGSTYKGVSMDLTVENQDLNIYVSGGQENKTADSSTACIFYDTIDSDNKTRPEITMSINETKFLAEYQVGGTGEVVLDPTMDIDLSATPLVITMTKCTDTPGTWTQPDTLNLGSDTSLTALEIATRSKVDSTQVIDGQRCDTGYGVKLTLPGGVEPVGDGEEYTFRGVTLTTTLTALDTIGG
jgi:hypothetical protein